MAPRTMIVKEEFGPGARVKYRESRLPSPFELD